MNDKMLDLVIKVDGGNPYSMLLGVSIAIIFAVVVIVLMARGR